MYTYIPRNVCSRKMNFEVENDIITKCEIVGGCTGNTQGLSKLIIGMNIFDVIKKLEGTQCRMGTSCPDQLAQGLKKYLSEIN